MGMSWLAGQSEPAIEWHMLLQTQYSEAPGFRDVQM